MEYKRVSVLTGSNSNFETEIVNPFSYQLYLLFFLKTHQKTSPSILLRILPHLAVLQILKHLQILDFLPARGGGFSILSFLS